MCNTVPNKQNLILTIGEILFDIFPHYKQMGGAPFNFAFHLKSLGQPVIFATRVGDDENGADVLEFLKKKGFDLNFIQVDPTYKTGSVRVNLNKEGNPEFSITKDAAYDYLSYKKLENAVNEDIRLIYYGTLIQRTAKGSNTMMKVLKNRDPKTKCFYDMNLRSACYNEDVIKLSLAHCDILKMNEEELEILKGIFRMEDRDELNFIDYLIGKLSIEWVSLTRGKKRKCAFYIPGKIFICN